MSDFVLELPGGVKTTNPLPIEARYLNGRVPYASVAEACTLNAQGIRHPGLTVLIGSTEYWWTAGNLGDSGLVVKTVANQGGVGAGTVLTTTYANALNLIAQNQVVAGAIYRFLDYPNMDMPMFITALDKGYFSSTGYLYDGGVNEYVVDVPSGYARIANGPGNDPVFQDNFTVSQNNGHTLGRFQDGDVVPARGKTAVEVLLMAAIDPRFPTYQPASIGVGQSATPDGEVGEAVNNSVQGGFSPNDAGALVAIRLLRNGALLGVASNASPIQRVDSTVRVLGSITYQAVADYSAGSAKNVQPANTPDPRAAQVRSPYAPQAAENGFGSGLAYLNGYYRYFYGPVASVPAASADVRALPSRLSNAGGTFELNTGNTQSRFALALPPNVNLQRVIDLDALNADLTSQYQVSNITVKDAGGNDVAYKLYVMQAAAAYSSPHRHQITVG